MWNIYCLLCLVDIYLFKMKRRKKRNCAIRCSKRRWCKLEGLHENLFYSHFDGKMRLEMLRRVWLKESFGIEESFEESCDNLNVLSTWKFNNFGYRRSWKLEFPKTIANWNKNEVKESERRFWGLKFRN